VIHGIIAYLSFNDGNIYIYILTVTDIVKRVLYLKIAITNGSTGCYKEG